MSLFTNSARGSDLGFLNVDSNQPLAPSSLASSNACIAEDVPVLAIELSTQRIPREEDTSIAVSGDVVSHNAQASAARLQPCVSKPKLNRIAEVRNSQGVSEKTLCKRLNIGLDELRRIEDPTCDLSVSQLVAVQLALDVPLVDLLEDSNSLSRPVQERAKLVKVMKTAAAIKECKLTSRAMRLAEMLREQLLDLMPELSDVSSWPQFGSRRGSGAVARILAQEINTTQLRIHD